MVWQFIDVFKKVGSGTEDDDYADRLSHRYTVALLLVFCVLVGSTQLVGSPISCWVPAHFSGAMTSYTNNICWISNTYYVPTDDALPKPSQTRQYRINYYQWVPFILSLMALLFYSPFAIWHVLSRPATLDAHSVMKLINKLDSSLMSETRDKSVRAIVKLIDRSIDYQHQWYNHSILGRLRRMFNRGFLPLYKRNGSYISTLYMLVKILYVVNVCGQFFLLNAFLGPNFNIYGLQVIRDLWFGRDFWESQRFPRVTMCDFTIRTLGENNQKHTIQCVLSINLFNEKIFMFLWFWLVFVSSMSVYSFLTWLFNFTQSSRASFIKRYLKVHDHSSFGHVSSPNMDSKIFDSFVFDYLRQDGVFLLRIIKKNTNDLVVGELVSALWENFKRSPKHYNNGDDTLEKEECDKLNVDNSNAYKV